jgi:hypothetical protein
MYCAFFYFFYNYHIHIGKSLLTEAKSVIAALRNNYIPAWKEELNEDGSIPSGKSIEEIVNNVRTKLYQLSLPQRAAGVSNEGEEKDQDEEEEDAASPAMPNDWYPKYWLAFLYVGPPWSKQHELEVCSQICIHKTR